MNNFARLPAQERQAFFQETAQRRRLNLEIVEKDFWVCWILGQLFGEPAVVGWRNHLVFKGGTSLSKVYGIIRRFSEDIDLSVSPEWLGFDGDPPESRSGCAKWFERLQGCCASRIREIQIQLERRAAEAIGQHSGGESFFVFEEDAQTRSPVLLFSYPSVASATAGYIRRDIKLEFGSLTDQQPTGDHAVKPWVAEEYPEAFTKPQCPVVCLEAERTFWEKVTLLHAYCHLPPERPLPPRLGRHMYDMHCLANHLVGERALTDLGLLARVVEHKQRFFSAAWTRYETACPGSLRLVPDEARIGEWRRDYARMREMFMDEPPAFERLVESLRALEMRINRNAEVSKP